MFLFVCACLCHFAQRQRRAARHNRGLECLRCWQLGAVASNAKGHISWVSLARNQKCYKYQRQCDQQMFPRECDLSTPFEYQEQCCLAYFNYFNRPVARPLVLAQTVKAWAFHVRSPSLLCDSSGALRCRAWNQGLWNLVEICNCRRNAWILDLL